MQLNATAAGEAYDELDRLTPDALIKWWTHKLRRALSAARELPFYARRFGEASFDPSRFRSLADLRAVPISTKGDMLAALRSATNRAVGIEQGADPKRSKVTLSLSSGTAGTTFITHTARWRQRQGLSSCRAHWWAGLRPGTPFLISAPAWHAYASIQPFIAKHFALPCVVISGTYLPRFADRIVDAIVNFRPRFLTMFLPMVFSTIAAAGTRGLRGDQLFAGVESMVVTGAPITPGMRRHLSQLLGVKRVAELAGSSENLLAVDCVRAQGLHLVPDTCYADVLDRETGQPLASGQRGKLVHSSVIPAGSLYLQYDGGDIATIDRAPCQCGLPSPRIKIVGRWEDCITLGGQTLLPYDVQLAVEEEVPELEGVACVIGREALVQGRLRLMLVEPAHSGPALLDGARSRLARRFGVAVEIAPVRDLPLRFKGVPPILSEAEVTAEL